MGLGRVWIVLEASWRVVGGVLGESWNVLMAALRAVSTVVWTAVRTAVQTVVDLENRHTVKIVLKINLCFGRVPFLS